MGVKFIFDPSDPQSDIYINVEWWDSDPDYVISVQIYNKYAAGGKF